MLTPEEIKHYHHLQAVHRKLLDHSWSRQQTHYDSAVIAWLEKELMAVSNEAYSLTQLAKAQDVCPECGDFGWYYAPDVSGKLRPIKLSCPTCKGTGLAHRDSPANHERLRKHRKELFPHGHKDCYECEDFVTKQERERIIQLIISLPDATHSYLIQAIKEKE